MTQPATTGSGPQTCPDCHALVADLDGHARWHARFVADMATAVEDEIRRTSSSAGERPR